MSTAASGLRELHQLHLKLKEIAVQLERGPRQIEARRQLAKRKETELNESRNQLLELRKAADAKSLQLKSNEAKIAELQTKLNAASSNREYDIFRSHIDADKMANSVLEDEILEVLDKIDLLQVTCGELEKDFEQTQAEAQRVTDVIAAQAPEQERQLAELSTALAEAERMLPGQIADVYRRLVHAHGAGALAPVVNGACTECFVGLSPQSRVELNSGRITFCKSCGRLLYQAEST